MRPVLRLFAALAVTIPCLLLAAPARAGAFIAQTDCDTLSTSGETAYQFMLFDLHSSPFCEIELRPQAAGNLPALPITSWVVPAGWTAEGIAGEPGAIVLHGCVEDLRFVTDFWIRVPGRSVQLDARSYRGVGGSLSHVTSELFWCGTVPVPALPASWGQIKSQYR